MSGDGHTNETRELNLDAIEARANAAYKGPWSVDVRAVGHWSESLSAWVDVVSDDPEPGRGGCRAMADADFIASAREDVPALVAEVRRLRERVDAAETEGFRLGIGAVVMSIDAASPDEVWRIVNTYREAAEEASS